MRRIRDCLRLNFENKFSQVQISKMLQISRSTLSLRSRFVGSGIRPAAHALHFVTGTAGVGNDTLSSENRRVPCHICTNKQSFENGVIGDLFIYFIKNQCVEAKKMVKSVH